MDVILVIGRAGDGFVQNAGEQVTVSADEGKRMIENGSAVPVRAEKKKIEKAIKK